MDWPEQNPLRVCLDAAIDALMAVEVGARDNVADGNHPMMISIDLDPVSAGREPIAVWTPAGG